MVPVPKVRISIKTKVIVLVAALTIFSIGISGWLAYTLAEDSLLKNVGDRLQIRTTLEKARLDAGATLIANDVGWLAKDSTFTSLFADAAACRCGAQPSCETAQASVATDNATASLQSYLEGYARAHPSLGKLSVACPDGTVIASSDASSVGESAQGTEAFELGRRDLYISTPIFSWSMNGAQVHAAAPLARANVTIGALIATASGMTIAVYPGLSTATTSEQSYVVNNRSQVATIPLDFATANGSLDISTQATNECFPAGDGKAVYTNYRGTTVIGYYSFADSLNACVISEIRLDEVVGPLTAIRNGLSLFAILLILGVIVVGTYVVGETFKPIEAVVHAAHEYRRGNLEQRVLVVSDDELGDLSRSINEMADDLRRSHLEISRHSAELEEDVRKRTAELEDTVKKEKEARVAVLNMLEDLNDALSEVRSLDRMKDEFLNNAAHELKTPLIPILGYAELALSGKMGLMDKEGQQVLEIIDRNAKRLKSLVDEILDVSKLESGSMKFTLERMNLSETLRICVQDMQPYVKGKGLSLEFEAPRGVTILGDGKRITQVMTNLINNSVKFTDKGGITVTVSEDRDRGMAVVRVTDTGIGIKDADLKHMFEKFYQAETAADRKYMGSGLGLSICRGIVNAHNGRVWVESEVGKGSTFAFAIPLVTGSEELKRQ